MKCKPPVPLKIPHMYVWFSHNGQEYFKKSVPAKKLAESEIMLIKFKKENVEIDSFLFTSFFGPDFFKYSGPLCFPRLRHFWLMYCRITFFPFFLFFFLFFRSFFTLVGDLSEIKDKNYADVKGGRGTIIEPKKMSKGTNIREIEFTGKILI